MSNDTALNILVRLFDQPATAKEIAARTPQIAALKHDGLVKTKEIVHNGRPGRPAHILTLTDKARKRVKRALANGSVVLPA